MRRREFIRLLGGAAATPIIWPLAARAQQPEKLRRIGVLNSLARTDAVARDWDNAFRGRLDELGLIDGRGIQLDYRWGDRSVDRMRMLAGELVRLNPDVLVAMATPATAALQAQTHSVPIVFGAVSDPVGSGFVASLARPGGNITGFVDIEGSLGGKWLELMREIAPSVSRVAFLFNPKTAPFARYYLDAFRAAAAALKIEPIEAPVHSAVEVEAVMTKLGRVGGAGVVVMPETSTGGYGDTIVSLADRCRLPAIYPFSLFVARGGLMSYGVDYPELLRGAASYVDRILKGARPDELPVQLPTKFELIINLKAAKTLGLTVPDKLLALANKVIE
jgi:putative tryptophan/tyrosine transport system substrate-binding protein